MSVCPLLAVLGLLFGRTAPMGSRDVLLFLGFCLYLALTGVLPFSTATKVNAILKNVLEIIFVFCHID